MKLNSTTLCLFAFAIFAASFNVNAENKKGADKKLTNSERAKEILEKARNANISYTTEKADEGGKYVVKTSKKYYPDGTFADRLESTTKDKKGKINSQWFFLTQVDGSVWMIIDDIAIKDEYASKKIATIKMNEKKIAEKFKYKLEHGQFKDIPCYKVTVIYPTPENESDTLRKVYYIDKKDYFIYHTDIFMKNGKKRINPIPDTIKKVKNIELNDELFKIPAACKIVKAKTLDEFILFDDIASVKQKRRLGDIKGADADEKHLKDTYKVSDLDDLLDKKYKDKGSQ